MELNERQHDALVELLNIGFGRAGASLSRLTGHRVLLEGFNRNYALFRECASAAKC